MSVKYVNGAVVCLHPNCNKAGSVGLRHNVRLAGRGRLARVIRHTAGLVADCHSCATQMRSEDSAEVSMGGLFWDCSSPGE